MGQVAHNFKDLTGQRFGRLTVLSRADNTYHNGKKISATWNIICDCGNTGTRVSYNLTAGLSKSCGCLCREISGQSRRLPNNLAARNANKNKYVYSARKRQLTWNLSDEQFDSITGSKCHYCGVEPKQICQSNCNSRHRTQIIYNGIDRVDNELGYEDRQRSALLQNM